MATDSKKKPSPIPEGATYATPYLVVRGAADALRFYQRAFGAIERLRIEMGDGQIGHAELKIGTAELMLADEFPSMGIVGPQTLGGTSVGIRIYVEDVDAFAERAIQAGAKLFKPVSDEFYGDRVAVLEDPFGHRWYFASRFEELSPRVIPSVYTRATAHPPDDCPGQLSRTLSDK
jgi:PhnB protein